MLAPAAALLDRCGNTVVSIKRLVILLHIPCCIWPDLSSSEAGSAAGLSGQWPLDQFWRNTFLNFRSHYTLIKKKKIKFLIYKEIQSGAVMYEEGLPNIWGNAQIFPIYEEAVSHIWLCNCSTLKVLIYEENLIFFFFSVWTIADYRPDQWAQAAFG